MSELVFQDLDTYRSQLAQALAEASRSLDWLDGDLAETGAQDAANAASVRTLLASSNLARVRLLLHSDAWFWRFCPRLIELQNIYGHAFEIRLLSEADADTAERFLLTDKSVVRRFHPDAARGEASSVGRTMAVCRQQFDLLWLRAEPPSEGRRLFI
ncbi:hypothetical protein [Chitinimonas sp.]|uniref:DUF7931 domain-containing protein n=1 Tax=Chitinimonas sp. TaxID=1934313 RepID=UPI002F94D58D